MEDRKEKAKNFARTAGNMLLSGVFTGIGMTGVGIAANAIQNSINGGKAAETFIKGASATGFFGGTGMFF